MAENENVNPQLDKETTSTSSEELQDPWKAFPWSDFRGYTKSQRAAATTSWIWDNGFDIELSADDSKRRWVCKVCVKLKKHPPHSTAATGTQNAEHHLFFEPNGRGIGGLGTMTLLIRLNIGTINVQPTHVLLKWPSIFFLLLL
jgi:hypothetical protein